MCISNTTPIDVNIASQPIGITTLQTIVVDTQLTEIGISSFPTSNANIDIVAQTLTDIQISSNDMQLATQTTADNINRNVNSNIGLNPFEEKLFSEANCVYQSNYKGSVETEDQLFLETDDSEIEVQKMYSPVSAHP